MSVESPIVQVLDGEPIRSKDWHDMQSGLRRRLQEHDHASAPLDTALFERSAALSIRAIEAGEARIADQDLGALLRERLPLAGGEIVGDLAVSGDLRVEGDLRSELSVRAPTRRSLALKEFNHTVSRSSGTYPNLAHNGLWAMFDELSVPVQLGGRAILSLFSTFKPNSILSSSPVFQHAVALEGQLIPLHAFAFAKTGTREELLSWSRGEALDGRTGWRLYQDAGYGALATPLDGRTLYVQQWVELPPGDYTIGLAAMGQGSISEASFVATFL